MEREETRAKLVWALHATGLVGRQLALQVRGELEPAAGQVAGRAGLELTEEVEGLFGELMRLAVLYGPIRKNIGASP